MHYSSANRSHLNGARRFNELEDTKAYCDVFTAFSSDLCHTATISTFFLSHGLTIKHRFSIQSGQFRIFPTQEKLKVYLTRDHFLYFRQGILPDTITGFNNLINMRYGWLSNQLMPSALDSASGRDFTSQGPRMVGCGWDGTGRAIEVPGPDGMRRSALGLSGSDSGLSFVDLIWLIVQVCKGWMYFAS
jgi:hypothetical protein